MQPASIEVVVPPWERPGRWSRTAVWCRAALIFGWLAMLVLTIGLGARHSTYAALESAIQDGKVHRVDVAGEPAEGPIGHWASEVHVTWRRGLVRYTTTVTEANTPRADYSNGVTAIVPYRVSTQLRSQHVEVRSRLLPTSEAGPLLGWSLPGWMVWPLLAVWLGTLMSVVGSPPPWRATRWAWFWLVFVAGPLGVIAYLTLAGPAPLVREPQTTRRLTGGWALLLAMAISAATATGAALG